MQKNTSTLEDLLGQSITLSLAGQPLQLCEMTVRQTLQLLQHRAAIAALDWSDIPALLEQHQALALTLLSIMLATPEARLLDAKNSELMAALQAGIALNKSFFLQAVQSAVAAMQVKAALQTQLANLPTPAAGPAPSASSSPLATANAMSMPTPPASSTPTAPPSTI